MLVHEVLTVKGLRGEVCVCCGAGEAVREQEEERYLGLGGNGKLHRVEKGWGGQWFPFYNQRIGGGGVGERDTEKERLRDTERLRD